MDTVFFKKFHLESFDEFTESLLQIFIKFGLCHEVIWKAQALSEIALPHSDGFGILVDEGVVVVFHDSEEAKRAAFALKNRLVCGTYSVPLNENAPFEAFFSRFVSSADSIEKAVQFWKVFAQQEKSVSGVFVPVCLYKTPIGVQMFGSLNSDFESFEIWKNSVLKIIENCDSLARPAFGG